MRTLVGRESVSHWPATAALFARDLALARAESGVAGGPAVREVASGHQQRVHAIHFDGLGQAYSVGGTVRNTIPPAFS